jgi:hypothetical protein
MTKNGGIRIFHWMALQAERTRFCLLPFYYFPFQDMTLPALFFCIRTVSEFPDQTGLLGGMGIVAGKTGTAFYDRHIMRFRNFRFLMTA